MSLVNEFFHKQFVEKHHCTNCGRHFPLSVLINLDSPFPEINGKYCTVCYHKIYDLLDYCDECGEEFPKRQLYKNVFDETIMCMRCLQNEQNS
jgi:hypothetical protein